MAKMIYPFDKVSAGGKMVKERLLPIERDILERIEKYGAVSRNEVTNIVAAALRRLSNKGIVEGYSANKTTWWRLKK